MAGELSNPVAPTQLACSRCGSTMPASAAFCPGCGRPMRDVPAGDRGAAALAYLTLVPAVVLLVLPLYRRNNFVRFHAWQSVLLWGAFFLLSLLALFLSDLAAVVVFLLLGILASLAMFFLWLVLSLKAWQGERFELPLLGQFAGRLP